MLGETAKSQLVNYQQEPRKEIFRQEGFEMKVGQQVPFLSFASLPEQTFLLQHRHRADRKTPSPSWITIQEAVSQGHHLQSLSHLYCGHLK